MPKKDLYNKKFRKEFEGSNPIDLLEENYEVIILTLKVSCPKCGHVWGIKCDEFENSIRVPKRRFICTECLE